MGKSFSYKLNCLVKELESRTNKTWLALGPIGPFERDNSNPYSINGRTSFVPELGNVVWTLSDIEVEKTNITAKIYVLNNQKKIGLIRVPHYNNDDEDVNEIFRKVIPHFNKTTDALVLDQVNNNGGSLFQAYNILSYLTDIDLEVPKHHMTLSDDQVEEAEEIVWLSEVQETNNPDEWPSPEIVKYSQFIMSEVKAGRQRYTNPGYVFGIEKIEPSDEPYIKPIIVLINELTFSAPEFLVAILQDNNKALLFGMKTAGAGGLMKHIATPGMEKLKIEDLTLTWTVAKRTNGKYIENYGVQPDIKYEISVSDIKYAYKNYREKLLKVIDNTI